MGRPSPSHIMYLHVISLCYVLEMGPRVIYAPKVTIMMYHIVIS